MVRTKSTICWIATLAVCVALAGPSRAHDEHPPEREMSPEEQAMMAAWQQAMTPGEPHAFLARQAGSWSFSSSFWMEPGEPPMESTGTVERRMILGGRVLEEKVDSTMMGQPFEGIGHTGYDNVTGEYWSTWTDNMGTGVMTSTGTCTEEGHCTFMGSYNDPMTGQPKQVRITYEATEDREVMAMYEDGPDGEERKTMELVYTR